MPNRSINYMRRRTMSRHHTPPSRQSQPSGTRNRDAVIFESNETIPKPVTRSEKTVIFDFHQMFILPFTLFANLKEQFGDDQIIMVNMLSSIRYCTPACTVLEVLFASENAKQRAITRGLIMDNGTFKAVAVADKISYKELFHTLPQVQIEWPLFADEYSTRCTVFEIHDLPLDCVNTTIAKIKSSIQKSPSPDAQHISHPVISVFQKQCPGTLINTNSFYVVVYGHVDTYSVFDKSIRQVKVAQLDAYDQCDGFAYESFKFDKTFCFKCNNADCHLTSHCPMDKIISAFPELLRIE